MTMNHDDYLKSVPEERQEAFLKIIECIDRNIPEGFEKTMSYGMIGWVVTHKDYPSGYHCDPKLPLPFINLASQKNFIALYHMGIYADTDLLEWFQSEYPQYSSSKMDMGKSCIRFKKTHEIPYELIAQLVSKISVKEWIALYEKSFIKKK